MIGTLTPWLPSRSPLASGDPLVRLFDGFFNGDLARSEDLGRRAWMPAVDIRETDNAYVLEAELPGMTKKDIHITLENNVLRLGGERRFEHNVDQESYHRVERCYGSFSRSFTLPSAVNPDQVEASFKDGILTVTVPKSDEARPRRIAIR